MTMKMILILQLLKNYFLLNEKEIANVRNIYD